MDESVITAAPLRPVDMGPRTLSHLPERPPVDIEFSDVSYTVPHGRKGSKIILRNVSGLFRSGQLTAILGPSGAGKSTLLNVLAGYRCIDATGTICTNGQPRDLRLFRKLTRYIMQDDMLQPHMSVFEAMRFTAALKLGHTLSRKQKLTVIAEILEMLRLNNARDTVTSKLSGGERKRLAIALELLNNPPIIFLDEPTTGLDDLSSSQCVTLLKMLAQGGRTVICSIHTPSARLFAMFDHVYIVGDGQCVFQGQGHNIVPFLASIGLNCPLHYNPADFVIEVSSGEYGDHLEEMVTAVDNGKCYRWVPQITDGAADTENPAELLDCYHESCTTPLLTSKDQYNFNSSSWVQFRILVYRSLLQCYRNSTYFWIQLSLNIFVGFIIGGLFFQFGHDGSKTLFNFGFCYTCTIFYMYVPMLPILLSYPSEVKLLKREYFNRWYSFNAYFFATTISRLPIQLCMSIIYLTIVYFMTDQPLELSRVAIFFVTCQLIAFTSESLAVAIGSYFSLVNAMFLGPALSVPLILLAVYGLGTTYTRIPLFIRICMQFSYVRYGLQGLVMAIYGNGRRPLYCPPERVFCEYNNPRELLRQTGMESSNVWLVFGGLVGFFVVFRIISYLLLRWRLASYRSFAALTYVRCFVKRHFNITQYR